MPHSISAPIEDERDHALSAIEAAAADARARHITPGAETDYALKRAEAAAILAGDSTPTPIIDAEADAAGETRAATAARIQRAIDRSDQVLAQIAAIRGPARERVRRAEAHQAIAQARAKAREDLNEI